MPNPTERPRESITLSPEALAEIEAHLGAARRANLRYRRQLRFWRRACLVLAGLVLIGLVVALIILTGGTL